MYKLTRLDDSANGFYCAQFMCSSSQAPALVGPIALLLVAALAIHCKSEPAPASETAASETRSKLQLEILSLDTSFAPRDGRPFVAGEEVRITLKVEGGTPPYDIQLVTLEGPPTLASGSTRVESMTGGAGEVAMQVRLNSEIASGTYRLLLRVSDHEGSAASVHSETFALIGSDAALAAPDLSRAQLQLVDVAGRARAAFYQGEEIRIRAQVLAGSQIKIGIFAADDRPFMPVQEYEAARAQFELALRIPRMARVGSYRIQLAGPELEASADFEVTGASFSEARTPVLENLTISGGPDLRVPRGASLLRGEKLRVEARVGGVQHQALGRLRLRNRSGKIVTHSDLGEIIPSDPHPAARSLLSAEWTPTTDLPLGRHVLEIEVIEGDELTTLYREVVLR